MHNSTLAKHGCPARVFARQCGDLCAVAIRSRALDILRRVTLPHLCMNDEIIRRFIMMRVHPGDVVILI